MSQITARISEDILRSLDNAAKTLQRSRADIIRQAIESYLEDFDDIAISLERLRDPSDETLDWDEAKRALLNTN